jgi:hypothetical protein
MINSGIPASYNHQLTGTNDYGYKTDIRDWEEHRAGGFTYNVGGGTIVIRGRTGLCFASPVSNVTFSPQFYSTWSRRPRQQRPRRLHHQPDQRRHLRQGLLRRRAASPRRRSQSRPAGRPTRGRAASGSRSRSITGFDVDLTHWTEYRDTRTIDANLQYPATGYNLSNGAVPIRPNPAYGGVFQFTSDGSATRRRSPRAWPAVEGQGAGGPHLH